MSPALLPVLFICGGAGAWCRFALDRIVDRGNKSAIPLGTFTVNVSGSLGLGLVTGLCTGVLATTWGAQAAHTLSTILGAGFLGGFTTFSTATVEAVQQLRQRRVGGSLLLLLIQPCTAFTAAALGLRLAGS